MGISIQVKGKAPNQQYRLYSTSSDRWIGEAGDRNHALAMLNERFMREAKVKVIEEFYRFPHMWPKKVGNGMLMNEAGCEAYRIWLHKAADDFSAAIDRKYQEILKLIAAEPGST